MRERPEDHDARGGAAPSGPDLDDRPPLLGSWRNLYLLVLGNLALTVLVFWLVTRAYA